jgi:HD-GYP domain-containing protein (c-di-GMP phosphodiesterase class II)
LARILAVADLFDAMTNNRHYRTAMPIEKAIDEPVKNTQFNADIVNAFVKIL